MDKPYAVEGNPLLDAAIEAGQALGLTIHVVEREPRLGTCTRHAMLRIEHGGQQALYAAEVRPALRPANLGATLLQLERLGQQALLITDYVTPTLADELKARRVAFLDTAGNVYLDHRPCSCG